jgi:hypothetical protein
MRVHSEVLEHYQIAFILKNRGFWLAFAGLEV